jgi:SAM-dependent methyltransferase
MEEIVYHTNYQLEDTYWWFVARNKIVLDIINKKCQLKEGDDFLDAGCGTGGFTKQLGEHYNIIGLDSSEIALEYCRKRGLKNLYKSYLEDFPKNEWNVKAISMLDVVEHIDDDIGVLKTAYDILPAGGYFIATVPAYMWLWSRHDEIHMHKRRYNKSNFTDLLRETGFKIEFSTYINSFLLIPAMLKRFAENIFKISKADEQPVDEVSPLMNKIFEKIFKFEGKLLSIMRFPFGLSIFVIARKM